MIGIKIDMARSAEKVARELKKEPKRISKEGAKEISRLWNQIYRECLEKCPIDTNALKESILKIEKMNSNQTTFYEGYIGAGSPDFRNPKNGQGTDQYCKEVHDGHYTSSGTFVDGKFYLTDPLDGHLIDLEQAIIESLKKAGAK